MSRSRSASSAKVGRGTSRTAISFSSSTGSWSTGARTIDGGVAALQGLAELAERTDEPAVVEPGVQVLEHDQRGFLESAERLERGVRVLGLGRGARPRGSRRGGGARARRTSR